LRVKISNAFACGAVTSTERRTGAGFIVLFGLERAVLSAMMRVLLVS
jgi:hypothetical protein